MRAMKYKNHCAEKLQNLNPERQTLQQPDLSCLKIM